MKTGKDKEKDNLREAYRRGLEQGYYLGRKIADLRNRGAEAGEPEEMPDARLPVDSPLFVQQILEIARRHGVDYE
jgi:hypothetical protein